MLPQPGILSFIYRSLTMRSSVLNLAALALVGLSNAANVTEWKSQAIYQVMIDRYARTDGSTTAECEVSKFCGGTWAGLIKHLDYIQGRFPARSILSRPLRCANIA